MDWFERGECCFKRATSTACTRKDPPSQKIKCARMGHPKSFLRLSLHHRLRYYWEAGASCLRQDRFTFAIKLFRVRNFLTKRSASNTGLENKLTPSPRKVRP